MLVLLTAALCPAATISVDLSHNYERGDNYTYAPGDTFLIEAGRRLALAFHRFHGAPDKPIVFTNHGGQVMIGDTFYYGLSFDSCSYFIVSGEGEPGCRYGIKVDGTASGMGLSIGNLSTDCEIHHVEICSTGFAGIMAKKDYSGSPPVPCPVFRNLVIHDTYIHHTGGEGMYLGETKSPGMEFRGVHVYNNLVAYTGWDCFQIANAVEGVDVHNNVFYVGGLEGVEYQTNGFQIGDNTVGHFHHNIVMNAPAMGFIVMGSGDILIDSNYVSGVGSYGVFCDHRDFTIDNSTIEFRDNFFSDVGEVCFFRINNDLNQIVIVGNRLDGTNQVLSYCCGAGPNIDERNNTVGVNEPLLFADSARGDFHLAPQSPYRGIGLLPEGSNNVAPMPCRLGPSGLSRARQTVRWRLDGRAFGPACGQSTQSCVASCGARSSTTVIILQ